MGDNHSNSMCGFCRKSEAIDRQDLTVEERNAAIDALFDLADRVHRQRRAYRHRKGRR